MMIEQDAGIGEERLLTGRQSAEAELAQAETVLAGANHSQAEAALKVAILRYATAECHKLVEPEPSPMIADPSDTAIMIPLDFCDHALVYIVDHDAQVRAALSRMLEASGLHTEAFADGAAFLLAYHRRDNACLLADTALDDLKGLALLLVLGASADPMPVIMITDSSDIAMAVNAMNAGAVDFIEKPIGGAELIASVMRALAGGRMASDRVVNRGEAQHHFEGLTVRQRQIMALVLAGHPSKNIAVDLGISQRTVENHRAAIMRKSGSRSLPALARLALAAGATVAAGAAAEQES